MKAARIVVLGIALAAGGLAALLASKGDKKPEEPAKVVPLETVDVLVAKADIGTGQVITDQDIGWQVWPAAAAGSSFIRKSDKPDAIEEFRGAIVRSPFVSGEPIREAKVIHAKGSGYMAAILPHGMRAISTEISPETGAGGFILPNDHVDVILSRRDKAAEKSTGVEVHVSETILTNVRVLAIDQTVEEKNGQKVVVGKTATLELTPQQAETLALSRQLGTLSLALRSLVDSKSGAPEQVAEDRDNRRGSINTVRYGVTTVTTPR
jgi:pilus assembly protein CpaB